ncbi:hypothetical protein [Citrobacter sp. MNAZ 1397]|uniref:hypothetical protein n=1 Tax=Citrobacter sp. MNAZ 1397 TaxID=2911205 RepID=UPI002027391A|nr:hypothetical protein [Citrobacter sp. MNAZ 1397]MCL9671532.1 hypothetical protein [Citrobacter sp. MNAZ 1397]
MIGPSNKVTKKVYEDIERALLNASNARTKAAAKPYLDLAKYFHHTIRHDLDDYVEEQLSSAIIYADDASGRVDEKERKIDSVKHFLYKFKGQITLE